MSTVAESAEVAREEAVRAGHRYAETWGRRYRAWIAEGGTKVDMDPHEAMDAANECAHGWLPFDRKRDCFCWGEPRVKRTPDLMTTLKAKERPMTNPTPVKRKRGTSQEPPLLVRMIAELDAEIQRLTVARDRLKEVAER
jgi:hypothetical protein